MKLTKSPVAPNAQRPRRKAKNIRAHEVEDNYRPRLHRTVGAYLALKAWTHGVDCIVLSGKKLLQFFDMKATPRDRMQQIRKDLKPWFQGFIPSCPQANNQAFVNYLFLVRREEDTPYFKVPLLSPGGVKRLIHEINNNPNAPKTAFFSKVVSEGTVPTQEEILSELVLVVSGLQSPNLNDATGKPTTVILPAGTATIPNS